MAGLPTRNAVIVSLSLRAMAKEQFGLTSSLPAQFTASNRLKEFPTEIAKNGIARLTGNNDALSYLALEATFCDRCKKDQSHGFK